MMKFLRKYQYHIFLFTIAFFLLATFIGFGGYFFGSKGSPNDPIAEVNGEKIPLHRFHSHYNQALNAEKSPATLDENARKQKRDETLRDLIQGVVFEQEAERYGIDVPDQQVAMSIAQVPGFRDKEGHFDRTMYVQALGSQLHMTPHDFEEEQRQSIAFFKLRWLIQSCIKVTDKELVLERQTPGSTFENFVKTWKQEHAKQPFRLDDVEKDYRNSVWQQKVLWAFNQWFTQISQRTRVKTHLELLQGSTP